MISAFLKEGNSGNEFFSHILRCLREEALASSSSKSGEDVRFVMDINSSLRHGAYGDERLSARFHIPVEKRLRYKKALGLF